MKKLNIIVSLLLACVMILSLFIFNVSADPIVYDISEAQDGSLIATFDTDTLTISGSGRMIEYTKYSEYPYSTHRTDIDYLVFEDGCTIESIGAYAFQGGGGYHFFEEINLPSSVKSIGNKAFENCVKVSTITISGDILDYNIGEDAFNKLGTNVSSGTSKSASIPKSNIYVIESLEALGYEVTQTESSITPSYDNWPTYSIYELGSTTTSDVKAYHNKYSGSLLIKGNGKIIDDAYEILSGIKNTTTNIKIEEGITELGNNAFNNMGKVTSYNLPSSLTSIGEYAFYNNYNITSLSIPENVSIIGQYAFNNCSALTSINIPYGITEIKERTFENCKALSQIEIPNSVENIRYGAFSGCELLTEVNIPNSVVSIDALAFEQCKKLNKVTIPESVKSIGSLAFGNCYQLQTFNIYSDIVELDAFPFGHSERYTTEGVKISPMGKDVENKTAIVKGSNYYVKEALESLGYSVSVIGEEPEDIYSTYPSHYVCELGTPTAVDVKGYYNEYSGRMIISGIGAIKNSAYNSFPAVSGIAAKNPVLSVEIEEGITSIGNSSFRLTSCKSYKLPSTLETIGTSAFYENKSLTKITIPDGVTSIGAGAFSYCYNLYAIELSDNLTSIDDSTFYACEKLEELILPSTIESIGASAFYRCTSLDYFECLAKDVEIIENFTAAPVTSTYAMGYKAENKIAKIDASNAYLIECLEALGYNVITIGTPPANKYDSYPDYYSIEIGVEEPNNIVAYANVYTGVLEVIGKGEMDSCYSTILCSTSTSKPLSPITKVYIQEGITNVGSHFGRAAFAQNSSSTGIGLSIYLPDSIEKIGTYAFSNTVIPQITIPQNVSELESSAYYNSTCSSVIDLSKESQTINGSSVLNMGSKTTLYMYSTNTTMLEYAESENVTNIIFLDDAPTSGVLDNGIKWTYDIDTHTITFEGEGDIPTYNKVSDAPWYTTGIAYNPASTYVFGTGITSVGSAFSGMGGTRLDYGYGGSSGGGITSTSGTTVYAPASLSSSVYSAYPDAIVRDIEDYTSPEDADKEQETAIIVSAEPTIFIVTVPIRIDVSMDKDGVITTGTDYKVENECPMGPIIISEINVVSRADWEITDFNADYKNMKASSNKIGMTINEAEVETDGTVALNESLSSVIKNKESKDLSFEVKMPAQKTAIIENVLAVVFTLDFDKV